MEWRLRRAEPADAAALSLVASATFLETYADEISGENMVAHCAAKCSPAFFAGWLAAPDHHLTIAEHANSGAPLGYTALTPPDLPIAGGAELIELRRIYVLLPAIGGGLGSALMARAIVDARALGNTRLALGVNPRNTRARAFYERHGFQVIGEREFQVGAMRFVDPVYALNL